MNELKNYQIATLEKLHSYVQRILNDTTYEKPYDHAFYEITGDAYFDHEITAPHICVQMPTGGGKTLVACHALHVIHHEYLQVAHDHGLVIWLVPTDTILTQTINNLKNRRHLYRKALDSHFERVLILDINSAMRLTKTDLDNNFCVLVSTYAAFRIDSQKQSLRKAFRENGLLMEHFSQYGSLPFLYHGIVIDRPSLVNLIKIHHPIVVVDEGHNTQTDLSYEMIAHFDPSFVIEYTATPRHTVDKQPNVLVKVGSSELKNEEMVKIPMHHHNYPNWENALCEGVAQRNLLEKLSVKEYKTTGEYIRPIALIQAELDMEKDDKIHVKRVYEYLTKNLSIPKNQIAIKTANCDDIQNQNLYLKNNSIRYIITVKALAEGWDNTFAYVLISVANVGTSIGAKQIIGRVLRLPSQRLKKIPDLNYSYIYTSSQKFNHTIKQLESGLVSNGYETTDLVSNEMCKSVTRELKLRLEDVIELPCISVDNDRRHRLDFDTDLIGDAFFLSGKETLNELTLSNQSGVATYDVSDNNVKIVRQTMFKSNNTFTGAVSEVSLVALLEQKIRRRRYGQDDLRHYLHSTIRCLSGKHSLIDLYNNITLLINQINDQITRLENQHATETFDELLTSKKLICTFFNLPKVFHLTDTDPHIYSRHLYTNCPVMNNEEADLARQIDSLNNIKWWFRNPESNTAGFYIQGWEKHKFYPDFIVRTNRSYYIVEYKGKQLLSTDDTKYKIKLGELLAGLAGDNYTFKLIHPDNINNFISELSRS